MTDEKPCTNLSSRDDGGYKMKRAVLAFLMIHAASVFAVGVTQAAEKKLTGPEITAALAGKSGTWSSADGKTSGKTAFTADTQTITGDFQGFSDDKAKWWVKGNQFCNQFTKVRSGKQTCQDIFKTGDKTFRFGNATTLTLN